MSIEIQKGSFFDPREAISTFKFVKPSPKQKDSLNTSPKIKGFFTSKNLETHVCQKGNHALLNQMLVFYGENSFENPQSILDLAQSHVRNMPTTQGVSVFGLILSRGGTIIELQFNDKKQQDDWMQVFKGVCILDSFHEEYKALKMIGKGGFAKVYLVESKIDGKSYAAKAFVKETLNITSKTNTKAALINEIEIMRVLDHDNIIRLHEVHETDKSIYLVMELIQGKPLQDVLRKPTFVEDHSEAQIMNMFESMLDALNYIASLGMMHRDLKPANILVERGGKIKIIDFGLATYVNAQDYIFKKCGTPGYIAPEVFNYDPKSSSTFYNESCDIFSAGCIFYFLLFGRPLILAGDASRTLDLNRDFDDLEIIYLIKKEIVNPDSKVNKEGLNLILQMLKSNPRTRVTAAEALEHPYFKTSTTRALLRAGSKDSNTGDSVKAESPSLTFGVTLSPLTPHKSRFTVKRSIYIDQGQPEMNGNIATLSNGSMNNSLLMRPEEVNSNPGTVSNFAKKDPKDQFSNLKTKGQSRSFKVQNTNQTFLKAAIFNNMNKNHEGGGAEEETKKSEFSNMRQYRKYSDDPSKIGHGTRGVSPDSSELNDSDNENCQIERDFQRFQDFRPKNNPHTERRRSSIRKASRSVSNNHHNHNH